MDHDPIPIAEHDVDRASHPERVHLPCRFDDQRRAVGQVATYQSSNPFRSAARPSQFLRKDRAARDVTELRTHVG